MPLQTDSLFEELNLSKEFRVWAKKNHVTPTALHKATGWTYQYCSGLLRGANKFGYKSFGLLVCAFGVEALADILRMAEFTHGGNHDQESKTRSAG